MFARLVVIFMKYELNMNKMYLVFVKLPDFRITRSDKLGYAVRVYVTIQTI